MVDPIITPIIGGGVIIGGSYLLRGLWRCSVWCCEAVRDSGWNFLNVSLRDDNKGALALIILLANRSKGGKRLKAATINMPTAESREGERTTFYIPSNDWFTIKFLDCEFLVRANFETEKSSNMLLGFDVCIRQEKKIELERIMETLKSSSDNLTKMAEHDLFPDSARIRSDARAEVIRARGRKAIEILAQRERVTRRNFQRMGIVKNS